MLIDTHCHLNNEEYENLDTIISEILTTDVKCFIISGCDINSSKEAIMLAHKYDNVYATVGFHPENCMNIVEEDFLYFDEWLKDDKVVAIGEIGLDYYYGDETKEKQKEIFIRQIKIAEKYNKPVVVHNRDAYDNIYNILKGYRVKGIIHCFNNDLEAANKFISLGFLLGIGGIITFKKNKLKEVVQNISLDNLVLETDSPYLTPEPFRGKQNSPFYLPLIASAIATEKGITYNEVASTTTKNVKCLFNL